MIILTMKGKEVSDKEVNAYIAKLQKKLRRKFKRTCTSSKIDLLRVKIRYAEYLLHGKNDVNNYKPTCTPFMAVTRNSLK